MAYKTMLQHLISKWGVMSMDTDMSVTNEDGTKDYMNNVPKDEPAVLDAEVMEQPDKDIAYALF